MKVLGIERDVVIDFDDRKKGEHVHHEGLRIHLGENIVKNGEGQKVSSIFVSSKREYYENCAGLAVGDTVRCSYNRFGSLDYIEKTK